MNTTDKETLTKRAKAGAIARWGLKAVAEGTLYIGSVKINCYVLNSKERVLSTKSILEALNMTEGGYRTGDRRLLRFAKGQKIAPSISEALLDSLSNPIEFKSINNRKSLAYPATVLPELCSSIISADLKGNLMKQQAHIAEQARILMKGFSHIGVIGLIDEATGYQYVRERNALATILEEFIAKEASIWVKTFPDDFYTEMFRLRGMSPEDLHKRPKSFGQFTHDIVYKRLAPQVVEELKKKNPKDPEGKRIHCHHQWLTKNKGYHKLEKHLAVLIAYMRMSKNWSDFMKTINKYLPIQPTIAEDETQSTQADHD